jgi:integrase
MPNIIAGMENEVAVPDGRTDIIVFDDKLRGFFLRVSRTGVATYGIDYRVLHKRRRMSLGPATNGTALTAARREAQRVLAKAKLGEDVLADREAAANRPRSNFGQLAKKFLSDAEKRLRSNTHNEWTRYLNKHMKPIHDHVVAEMERKDIVEQIDRIAKKYPVAADRAKTALSAFFAWCVEREHCETNPVSGISNRSANTSRSRVLDDKELAEIWRHAGDGHYGSIIRLLILTGQRRNEIGWLRWSEIDKERQALALPAERVKNARDHFLPLSSQAMAILSAALRRTNRAFLFGEAEDAGYSGWSRSKGRLDLAVAGAFDPDLIDRFKAVQHDLTNIDERKRPNAAAQKLGFKNEKDLLHSIVPSWTLHDLRRTFATGMAKLGVDLPVTEKMLNHVSGTFSGVQGVYQRHSFENEMRDAMELWGNHVEKLIGGSVNGTVMQQRRSNIL